MLVSEENLVIYKTAVMTDARSVVDLRMNNSKDINQLDPGKMVCSELRRRNAIKSYLVAVCGRLENLCLHFYGT